jgi:hypothetical protein
MQCAEWRISIIGSALSYSIARRSLFVQAQGAHERCGKIRLAARGLKKIESNEFTLRCQKNSQDSFEITDADQVPISCRELELRIPGRLWPAALALLPEGTSRDLARCIRDNRPSNDASKDAASRLEDVPGAQVQRGVHLRIA